MHEAFAESQAQSRFIILRTSICRSAYLVEMAVLKLFHHFIVSTICATHMLPLPYDLQIRFIFLVVVKLYPRSPKIGIVD